MSVLSNLTPGRGEGAEWLRLENAVCCRSAELDGPVPFRYQQPCAASPLGSTLGHPSLTPGASLLVPLGLARWLGLLAAACEQRPTNAHVDWPHALTDTPSGTGVLAPASPWNGLLLALLFLKAQGQ